MCIIDRASSFQSSDTSVPQTSSNTSGEQTSSEEETPVAPEETIPEITDPFAAYDFTGSEAGKSAGKYVGGVVGFCDAKSEMEFCYSLGESCEQVVGKAESEQNSDTVAIKTQEELQSAIMVETLNLSAPGAYKLSLIHILPGAGRLRGDVSALN